MISVPSNPLHARVCELALRLAEAWLLEVNLFHDRAKQGSVRLQLLRQNFVGHFDRLSISSASCAICSLSFSSYPSQRQRFQIPETLHGRAQHLPDTAAMRRFSNLLRPGDFALGRSRHFRGGSSKLDESALQCRSAVTTSRISTPRPWRSHELCGLSCRFPSSRFPRHASIPA